MKKLLCVASACLLALGLKNLNSKTIKESNKDLKRLTLFTKYKQLR